MNGKKAKRLRKHATQLLIRWIRSMTPDGEDATKITAKNLHEFLPEDTHIFANNKFMVSAYTLRWFYKKVKENPNATLEEILMSTPRIASLNATLEEILNEQS